ncbi:serine protease 27-like [Trachemys scripta elegans]|uniref:serine protease 27-like n=1 Tax=Trachemys scripta elegans TaxID=31138 RepID=UPI001551E63B|nr:serine protease 27-like [Trachemys scripta elegans]
MERLRSPLALALLAITLLQGAQGSWNQTGCGQPRISGRIVGGGDAPRGRWPWQVSIQHNGHHFCGGSLISAQWVVSAAHCFQLAFPQSAYRVNLGEHQLFNPSPSRLSSPVRQIIVHPNYNRGTHSADIALVQLTEPVRYTDEILPICLPGPSDSFPGNHTCWVTGWGRIASEVSLPPPKALQEVQVQLIDTAACNTLYNINPAPNIGRDPVKPDMICAGYAEGQRDSCQGDSGGPLACDYNGTWFLMGIVSWGDGCGQSNRPSVYVRTVAYGEWIWGHVVSGGQATTMENSTSGINGARPSFSTYTLLFTTLLMSL